jgi:Flp pilus assembly protein TadG
VPADRLRERGSAAVEFALLLPILLLLLLAFVQVGVIARDSLVLTQASRAGARVKLPRAPREQKSLSFPYERDGRTRRWDQQ